MDLCACLYIGDFPPPLSTGDTALSGNLPALLRWQRIEWPQVLIIGRGNHLTITINLDRKAGQSVRPSFHLMPKLQ